MVAYFHRPFLVSAFTIGAINAICEVLSITQRVSRQTSSIWAGRGAGNKDNVGDKVELEIVKLNGLETNIIDAN